MTDTPEQGGVVGPAPPTPDQLLGAPTVEIWVSFRTGPAETVSVIWTDNRPSTEDLEWVVRRILGASGGGVAPVTETPPVGVDDWEG